MNAGRIRAERARTVDTFPEFLSTILVKTEVGLAAMERKYDVVGEFVRFNLRYDGGVSCWSGPYHVPPPTLARPLIEANTKENLVKSTIG